MSDTPTPLQDRVAQLVHPYRGEERTRSIRMLAEEVGKVEREAAEAERLHIENLNLMRTIQQLRKALRRMVEVIEGDRMKNATQAAKDSL